MPLSTFDAESLVPIRRDLEALPGVERALVDPVGVVLLCESQAAAAAVLVEARKKAADLGWDQDSVSTAVRAETGARNRVRFEGVERIEEPDMRVRVRVSIEWRGRTISGEALGEKGENLELRTAAAAALDAITEVADPPIDLRLAGVKPIRAFDSELMVVSLYRPGSARNLLGAVLVVGDPRRAAALAVLHALNRVLGNYLAT
ncbi:MAG: hypothetical protein PVH00_11665 [Gemmatimonadota bacterium]